MALPRIGRQALHAWRIGFAHPKTGKRIVVTAPLPDDMLRFLEAAGLSDWADLNQPSARAMSLKTVPNAE
jgi:23S rRNA pseudouridine1911/1915/1917 synthase